MSELRKYAADALFYFPLIEDGDADFVTDYTPAAGDAQIFTDQLIFTNPTALILGFDSLSELPVQGAQLDENGAGTAEGVVAFTVIVSGTVGGGDAAGFFFMRSVTGQAWSNNDQIDINGGTADIATADSTTYDLGATAGLIADIGSGLFAAALSVSEMTCAQGQIHIIDSATKVIEDQAVQFHTYGNASALHALDLDVADGTNFTEAGGTGNHLTDITINTASVAAVWDRVLTGGTHNITNSAGRRLRTLQESGGVYGGQIYIDTVNGTAGTTNYENGTSDNAVASLADAKTISGSIGIPDFHVINGSSITLAESTANESYFGDNWTVALGGQACGGAHFLGADVSGIATGTGTGFSGGEIGTVTVGDDSHFTACGLSGTITLPVGAATFYACHHDGATAPILDFGAAVGSTTVHMHNYSGGLEIQNFGDNGTDIMHLDGNGKLTINANSSGGTINMRGNWEIEDNDGNAVINYDDQSQGYDNGRIWIDTLAGNAGTNDHINGTADSPSLTIGNAKTLSTSTGISDFAIINGSTITLAESTDNESYFGDNWNLALGGQSCDGAYFQGADVTGILTSAATVNFEGCSFGTSTIAIGHFDFCAFAGTMTLSTAGDYEFHNCYSKGATAPVFTKTAGQALVLEMHNFSGDITVSGLESGDTVELGGSFRTVVLNGADATVHIHGYYETLTNNLTGSPTVTISGAQKFQDTADILIDTAEIGTAGAGLTNINLPNQTMDITGDITGNLSGSVGSNTELGPAEVLTQANAALDTAIAELTQGAPTATPTTRTALMLLYMALRNRTDVQTSGTDALEIYNNAGTRIAQKLITDDGADYSEAEMTSGA